MNEPQSLWWRQARSDLDVLLLLREQGMAPCRQLHYLQMVTEKLAKAYFWGSRGSHPPKNHTGFVQFLRFLGGTPQAKRAALAQALGFPSFADLQTWIRSILPLAYDLEHLSPDLANDGPNPEYPWPHAAPTDAPMDFPFPIWTQLTKTGRGRQLVRVIELAVDQLPHFV